MTKSRDGKSSYDVGYGRPPENCQFKPGESGNPRGRPKAKPTLQEIFTRTAGQLVTVRQGEGTIRITKAEVVVRRLFHKAMEGDSAASKLVMSMADRSRTDEADDFADSDLAHELDEDALARMLARFDHLNPRKRSK